MNSEWAAAAAHFTLDDRIANHLPRHRSAAPRAFRARPRLQICAGGALDLRAAADRGLPAGVPAHGELSEPHHDRHGYLVPGVAELPPAGPGPAHVASAAAHRDLHCHRVA